MCLQQFLNKPEVLTLKFLIVVLGGGGHTVTSINVCCNLKVKSGKRRIYEKLLAICVNVLNGINWSRIL